LYKCPINSITVWKATKKFKRSQISIPPIRKSDRSWEKCGSVKATTFAEHLERVFTPHSNIYHNNSEIEDFLEIPCQMLLPIKPFPPRVVVQEIKNINSQKLPAMNLLQEKYSNNYQE
jgi:hypothetical protein